jgi:RHS repeat-associated protein
MGTTANTYQYDGLSRTTQMTDNNYPTDATSASTVAFAYDSLGRMVEEIQNGHAVDGAWFALDRRTGLTYPSNRNIQFTYDSLERVQTIQDSGAALGSYTYMGADRVLQRRYQNGTQLTYLNPAGTVDTGYDNLRRTVSRRDVGSSSELLVGFAYAYDRENNKSFEAKLHMPAASELYAYDSANRLTDLARGLLNSSNTGIQGAASETEDWTLDGLGNWRVNLLNGIGQTRSVNSVNEYIQIAGPGSFSNTDSYDANGNLILSMGQAMAYQWDYRNRLREVCLLSGSATACGAPGASTLATYSYDAMDRRTRKIVVNSGALNGTTNFYYDGWRAIEERDASDTLTQQFVFGVYNDEPLVLDHSDGQRYFYHQNSLYSTFALTDAGGNVVEGYQYEAYGQQTVLAPDFSTPQGIASAFGNPYTFTGQRFDPESGLLFYKSRFYSPTRCRFLQRDGAGYFDSMNLYEYVDSWPTWAVDPFGFDTLPSPGKPQSEHEANEPDGKPRRGSYTRDDYEEFLTGNKGKLTGEPERAVNRGCVGLCSLRQGANQTWPEEAPGVDCWTDLDKALALKETCQKQKKQLFVFAKQGYGKGYAANKNRPGYKGEKPEADAQGKVKDPKNAIELNRISWNYATLHNGYWEWMNFGVDSRNDPEVANQRVRVAPWLPEEYPYTIYCSGCRDSVRCTDPPAKPEGWKAPPWHN